MLSRKHSRKKPRVLILGKRKRVVTVLPPAAPQNLTINPGAFSIDLMWEHNGENTDGFRLYRKPFEDVFALVAEFDNGTFEWSDSSVEMGVIYTYYVVAFNSGGQSPASNEVSGELTEGG